MFVNVEATVWYTCYLDEKQEKMVKDYAEIHNTDLLDAVKGIYSSLDAIEFELYKDSRESDFLTKEILSVEDEIEIIP